MSDPTPVGSSLVEQVKAAMKAAMKARDKERLGTIRLIQAEFKRIEVDERVDVDDARALAVLDKMVKQRRDSASQYHDAGRTDLAEQEEREIAVLQEFLPAQLSETEIIELVDAAIAASGASGMQAMGAVMGQVKPQVQGRADMGEVSKIVKARLAS
ncbi:GatB/YqeY domain-containing protein [Parahaliea aestuarii]|uniref:GatB/YqeY domain-containing protein n=1 Tax=Parahaliea aestuarii TaxID=1852021 RepID=A0A5C8ZP97_9GAMM|nr:GatB/YqeY domain-containing protein [Parahaliea aestuarii]TXS89387.1 GatB/YqeY domain-containing protein [Parahaliea aestuarii]